MIFLWAGFIVLFFLAGCWLGYLLGYNHAQEEKLAEDNWIQARKWE